MKKNAVDNRMKERGLAGDFKKGGVGGLVEKTEIDWMADEVLLDTGAAAGRRGSDKIVEEFSKLLKKTFSDLISFNGEKKEINYVRNFFI